MSLLFCSFGSEWTCAYACLLSPPVTDVLPLISLSSQVVDQKVRTLEVVVSPGDAKAQYEAFGAEFGVDLFTQGPVHGELVEADPLNACVALDSHATEGVLCIYARLGVVCFVRGLECWVCAMCVCAV